MAQYTTTQIQQWISRANKCLYKLGTKSTDERFFENDNSYEDERLLIYILKRSVSWLYQSESIDNEKLSRVVSLLISRITIYGYGNDTPIYNTGSSQYVGISDDYIGGIGQPPQVGVTVPNDLTLVGGTDITIGVTSFSDTRLAYRFRIIRNNVPFFDWYRISNAVYLTGIGDQVADGDVFVFQFY